MWKEIPNDAILQTEVYKRRYFQVNNRTLVVCLILLLICVTVLAIVSSKAKKGRGCDFCPSNVGDLEIADVCLMQVNGLVNAEETLGDF